MARYRVIVGGRLLVLIGVFVGVLVSVPLHRLGLLAGAVGFLVAAGVVLLVNRDDDGPAVAAACTVVAACFGVGAVVREFRTVGWATALAIDIPVLAAIVVAVWWWAFGRQRAAAVRALRSASESLGWRYRRPDRRLLRRVQVLFPNTHNRVRALYGAIDNRIDQLPVTFVARRSGPPVWLVGLPFAVPSAVVRLEANGSWVKGEDLPPGYPQALTASAVEAAMAEAGVRQFRVERYDLVVQLPPAADPDVVRRDAARVTALAGALPLDELRRYAADPATMPKDWVTAQAARRSNRRASSIGLIGVAALVLTCGLMNIGDAVHALAAWIMIGTATGLVILGVGLWFAVPPTPAERPVRADPETARSDPTGEALNGEAGQTLPSPVNDLAKEGP